MLHSLASNWWAMALRGLVAVLFGLLTFLLPGMTLAILVILFGAYALVDGIFNVVAFFRVASHHWALLVEGVLNHRGRAYFRLASYHRHRFAIRDRVLGN